jgi:hypothetical protein
LEQSEKGTIQLANVPKYGELFGSENAKCFVLWGQNAHFRPKIIVFCGMEGKGGGVGGILRLLFTQYGGCTPVFPLPCATLRTIMRRGG